MVNKIDVSHKLVFASVVLAAFFGLAVIASPQLAGTLGISAASSKVVIDLINAYSTVTFVITVIGIITGVGSVGSGVAATVLYLIKKKGKAKAAAW